jgi:DNA replication protein DnaC
MTLTIDGSRSRLWCYVVFGDPTYADSILDRLVHNAHRINLAGESLRRRRARSTAKD